MGTLLAYIAALALSGGIGYGIGSASRGERRGVWHAIEVMERRVAGIEAGVTESDLTEALQATRAAFRKEIDQVSSHRDTAALIEAAVDPLRRDLADLQQKMDAGFREGAAALLAQRSAINQELQGLISREEVQAAFAEVARATAAQEAQRQLQRQQEVFGARRAPARAQVPQDPDQALNAQLEAMNRRLAEITGQPAQA